MSLDLTDDKSTVVQVMAWCRQATSHYLSQYWPRSMSLGQNELIHGSMSRINLCEIFLRKQNIFVFSIISQNQETKMGQAIEIIPLGRWGSIYLHSLYVYLCFWWPRDDIFKGLFVLDNFSVLIRISLNFVLKGPFHNWVLNRQHAISWTSGDPVQCCKFVIQDHRSIVTYALAQWPKASKTTSTASGLRQRFLLWEICIILKVRQVKNIRLCQAWRD